MLTDFWPGEDRAVSRSLAALEFGGETLLAEEGLSLLLSSQWKSIEVQSSIHMVILEPGVLPWVRVEYLCNRSYRGEEGVKVILDLGGERPPRFGITLPLVPVGTHFLGSIEGTQGGFDLLSNFQLKGFQNVFSNHKQDSP
jgi:hypothetical protein